jgi:hypothetical protein
VACLGHGRFKNIDILNNSYWSYCEPGEFDDADCPIEIDAIAGLRTATEEFLQSAPYISDELDFDQRNDHSTLGCPSIMSTVIATL